MIREALAVSLIGMMAAGCGSRNEPPKPPFSFYVPNVPPGKWSAADDGTQVWVPDWLSLSMHDAVRSLAIASVTTTAPDIHPSIPNSYAGPPPGWTVVIMWPGVFPCTASPTGVAAGYTEFETRMVFVAWAYDRKPEQHTLPALSHEYTHAWVYHLTNDRALASSAGH